MLILEGSKQACAGTLSVSPSPAPDVRLLVTVLGQALGRLHQSGDSCKPTTELGLAEVRFLGRTHRKQDVHGGIEGKVLLGAASSLEGLPEAELR